MPPRKSRTPQRAPRVRSVARTVRPELLIPKADHTPARLRTALRAHVRANAESRPGVYMMSNAAGAVIYVGKSKALRARLLSYCRATGRTSKAARVFAHAHAVTWEHTPTEFAALLRELQLIRLHRPRFNVSMNRDEAPRGYLALTAERVPALRIVRRSDDPRAELVYGPFRRLRMLEDAMRALADATGVRDCAMDGAVDAAGAGRAPLWFADDVTAGGRAATRRRTRTALPMADADDGTAAARSGRVAGCLRHDVGGCAGPCIGGGESTDYARRVAEVRDFLAGRSQAPLDALRARMTDAAAALQFERAGAIKLRLAGLEWLAERLARFHANVDRLTFTYTTVGFNGEGRVYLVRRGTVRAEVPTPTTPDEQAALAMLARRVFSGPDPRGRDIPVHDLDELYLISAWFRRRPAELLATTR